MELGVGHHHVGSLDPAVEGEHRAWDKTAKHTGVSNRRNRFVVVCWIFRCAWRRSILTYRPASFDHRGDAFPLLCLEG